MFALMATFAGRFERDSVRPLLHDWNRRIVLFDTGSEDGLAISIQDGKLAGLDAINAAATNDGDVVIRGKSDDLMGLLNGSLSPGQAVLEDRILVSAQPEDQLKLDALSFALWDD